MRGDRAIPRKAGKLPECARSAVATESSNTSALRSHVMEAALDCAGMQLAACVELCGCRIYEDAAAAAPPAVRLKRFAANARVRVRDWW
jgi:hypothetical protein